MAGLKKRRRRRGKKLFLKALRKLMLKDILFHNSVQLKLLLKFNTDKCMKISQLFVYLV